MTLSEIKKAVDEGKTVCVGSKIYQVKKHSNEYNVVCLLNDYCYGLTWRDGVTMNDKEESFFIA